MSNEEKKQVDVAYEEKIDVMFQTYRKSLLDCIAYVAEKIKISSSMETSFQGTYALLHILNTQLNLVESFLKTYQRVPETL